VNLLLQSGLGLPNAEAVGEAMIAVVRVFTMVNDRIWALSEGQVVAYPTDSMKLLVAALAKLSLSIETFASEAGRSRTVVWVEIVRAAVRLSLLVRNGFDVLLHGGQPDPLSVHLQPVEGDETRTQVTPVVVGGNDADSSKLRRAWWRGAQTLQWHSTTATAEGGYQW